MHLEVPIPNTEPELTWKGAEKRKWKIKCTHLRQGGINTLASEGFNYIYQIKRLQKVYSEVPMLHLS